jgi:hypothetical protein
LSPITTISLRNSISSSALSENLTPSAPAQVPAPTKFDLIVNLIVAKAVGLEILPNAARLAPTSWIE